jgi:tRNA(Glu) U13 pseudouridine synthase TruD
MKRPAGEVAVLEQLVMAELGLGEPEQMRLPRGLRLDGTRRALRVRPEGVAAAWAEGVFRLEVELPAGSYATVLLEELFPEGLDEAPDPAISASRAARASS